MDLKQMMRDKKAYTLWIEYEGFEICIRYLDKPDLRRRVERCRQRRFDKRTHQPVEEISDERLLRDFARQHVKLGRDPCEECRRAEADGLAAKDCATCKTVLLWPENAEAWEIFRRFEAGLIRRQFTGGHTFWGIDYAAVDFAFRICRVPPEEQAEVLDKLHVCIDEKIAEEQKTCARET